jgi:hypothetical protein
MGNSQPSTPANNPGNIDPEKRSLPPSDIAKKYMICRLRRSRVVLGLATAFLGLVLAFPIREVEWVEEVERAIFWVRGAIFSVGICVATVAAIYALAVVFPWRPETCSCADCNPRERWQFGLSTLLAAPFVLAFFLAACHLLDVEIAGLVAAAIVSILLALRHRSDLVLLFVPIVLCGLFLFWFLPACTNLFQPSALHGDEAFGRAMRFVLAADTLLIPCVVGSAVRYLRTRERYFIVSFLVSLPGLVLGLSLFVFL